MKGESRESVCVCVCVRCVYVQCLFACVCKKVTKTFFVVLGTRSRKGRGIDRVCGLWNGVCVFLKLKVLI